MSQAPAASPPVPLVPPRRRRRWLRWLAGLLTLTVAVPVAVWLYLAWADEASVEQAVAATDRLDPRWRWDQILADRPAIADEVNSALQVEQVRKAHGRPSFDIPEKEFDEARAAAPAAPLTPEQFAALRTVLAKAVLATAEARKLRTMPNGRPRIKYAPDFISTPIPQVQDAREIAQLLYCDAVVRAEDGDANSALESCLALLNAGRSVGAEPFAIAALVRAACVHTTIDALERVLAQGQPEAALLAEMQTALERELAEPTLLIALRGERAGHFELLQLLCSGKLRQSQLAASIGLRQPEFYRLFGDYIPARAQHDRAAFLRQYNALVEAAKLPIEQQSAEFDRLLGDAPAMKAVQIFPFAWLENTILEHLRAQANLRCAIVAVAAERHRQKHGAWPASLDVLVKDGLLKEVPVDPYAGGAPVRRAERLGGIVVYSVGPDGRDNGGNVQRHFPDISSQRRVPSVGTDQGFRLWDAALRGKVAP